MREIREGTFISDFSNWKDHDSYAKVFDRLLRDLKAGARDGATAYGAFSALRYSNLGSQ
jgi:hypothetical protein